MPLLHQISHYDPMDCHPLLKGETRRIRSAPPLFPFLVILGIYAKKVLLFGYKMEVPLEVINAFLISYATVLAIMSFQSGEIALKAISGNRD